MTDHMKKQKDFKKVQMRKFSAGDVPALVKARSSLSSSSSLVSHCRIYYMLMTASQVVSFYRTRNIIYYFLSL